MVKQNKKVKEKTPSFVAEFELELSSKGFAKLEQMLRGYRQIYNATLGELKRKLTFAKKSSAWQEARQLPKNSPERLEAFAVIRKNYQLSEVKAQAIAANYRQGHLEHSTNSRIVQQIAKRAWQSIEKYMFGKSKRVRFRKANEFNSFSGNDNKTGVTVQINTGTVKVSKLVFLYKIDSSNPYHLHALNHRVKFSRIIKKIINGSARFYVQMVVEGIPYQNPAHTTEKGELVGLDLGPRLIAISTSTESFQQEFCPSLANKQTQIRQLQRAIDRSRRKNNPQNYTEKGVVKKGRKLWNNSKNYKNLQSELKEVHRKLSSHRKSLQGNLANRVLKMGNRIKTEKVSYKAWQKLYGKSVSRQAPSAFISILTRKAQKLGGGVDEINTYLTALSQHCICSERKKKLLSQRTHLCDKCGFLAPRDELSAYLAIFTSCHKGLWLTDFNLANQAVHQHRTLLRGLAGAVPSAVMADLASPLQSTNTEVHSSPRTRPLRQSASRRKLDANLEPS